MTVALSDTKLLHDMLSPLPDFSDCVETANATSAFYVRRKPMSATINTLANALYKVIEFKRRQGVHATPAVCSAPITCWLDAGFLCGQRQGA